MPGEWTPPPQRAWLAQPLGAITRVVLLAPKLVVLFSVVLAGAAIMIGVQGLGFRSSRLDLLNPESSFNRRWLAYLDEFGDRDDIVLVVQGSASAEVSLATDQLAKRLKAQPRLSQSILYQRELSQVREKALHYLDVAELRQLEQFLDQFNPVLQGDWDALNVVRWLEQSAQHLEATADSTATGTSGPSPGYASQRRWAAAISAGLLHALRGTDSYELPWQPLATGVRQLKARLASSYLHADQGRLGFVILRIPSPTGQSVSTADLETLRRIAAQVETEVPAVSIGMTGMPVLENDEMRVSQEDTAWASVFSLFGVAAIFAAGFGGVRRPLLAVAVLLIGLSWTIGFITIAVGHLNILSVAFGLILIGLGIDFGVHYSTQYTQQLLAHEDQAAALVATARSVGPGIVTGGVTTSLAFCTAALTNFTGIAELGVIAAGGIVMCVLAAILVLPAVIMIWDSRRATTVRPLPTAEVMARIERRPRWLLLVSLVMTALLAFGVRRVHYDFNLLNLQAEGLASVELERRLSARASRGIWFAVSVSENREELLARRDSLARLPEISGTEEIASLIPTPSSEKRNMIARIQSRLVHLPASVPRVAVAGRGDTQGVLNRVNNLALLTPQQQQFAMQAGRLALSDYVQRVAGFQQRTATELLDLLLLIRSMADPEPPTGNDLPAPLLDRFVGRNGQYLLRVYGQGNIWQAQSLEQFVRAVESVDPNATGHPIQTFYASRQMYYSFLHAAIYALLAVAVVLMIDFRRIRCAVMAMIPMALGMLQMLGLLGWLGIPLNPANLIVLPLILGIGIDDGVHVIHDFLKRPHKCYQISNATATAIVITSATTMIGFGSMMLATHRGLRSLGQVLTLGILCCLVSTLIVLPQLLRAFSAAFSDDQLVDKLRDSDD